MFADVHLLASFSVLFSAERAVAVKDSQIGAYGDPEYDTLLSGTLKGHPMLARYYITYFYSTC